MRSPSNERLALADQHEREVGERREVARAADRALRGDDGHDVALEQRAQQLDELDAHARVAAPQRLGEQEEHAAHGVARQRLAGADGVRAHQVALQRARVRRVDAHAREAAEAGREAVHGLARGDEPLDRGAPALDARALVASSSRRRGAAGDGLERGKGGHGHRCYWTACAEPARPAVSVLADDIWPPSRARPARPRALVPRLAAGSGAPHAHEQPRPGRGRGSRSPRRVRRHRPRGALVGGVRRDRRDAAAASRTTRRCSCSRASPSASSARTTSRRAC